MVLKSARLGSAGQGQKRLGMDSPVNERERFEKFTERARKVLSLAQEEAYVLNHDYIGTEHLLLGLVREGDGIAAGALLRAGVDLAAVRIQIIQVLKQSAEPGSEAKPDSETED
jgi:ATP-dependent Clp protease ATP-binding subunit ClpA